MAKTTIARQFNRLLWLANTIKNGPVSKEEINDLWLRSEAVDGNETTIPDSTFYRWLNEIKSLFNIDIECDSNGKYSIVDSEGEQIEFHKWLIDTFSINNLLKDNQKLKSQILFEPVNQKHLQTILHAMREKRSLKITHKPFAREQSVSLVDPYYLKMFKQRWYMLAYSHKHNMLRIYSLDRITHVEPTAEKYNPDNNFDVKEYFKYTYGVSMPKNDEKPEEIKISIDNYQANYLRTLPLHHSQKEVWTGDWESEFEYKLIINEEFKRELRAYGPSLEVLEPEWLREEFRKEAERTLRAYKKTKGKN